MFTSLSDIKDIKSVFIGIIIVVFVFRINIFKILSKLLDIVKTINDCIKTLLIIVPLFLVVRNIKTLKGFLDFLGFFDNTGIYKSAKDLTFYLNKNNKNNKKK